MKPRALLVMVDSNRVTCGKCSYLYTVVTGGTNDEWACNLFRYDALLGLKSHMKTPNRPRVCTDAEKAVDASVREELVSFWHDKYDGTFELHEFLGMTWEEYAAWLER